jgi:hypothetical protein
MPKEAPVMRTDLLDKKHMGRWYDGQEEEEELREVKCKSKTVSEC